MRLFCFLLAALTAAATLQGQTLFSPEPAGPGATRTAGSLTTTFVSDSGFAGNMFDILPLQDLEITGIDVNITWPGSTQIIDVFYIPGTSVGNESGGQWVLLGSVSVVSAGEGQPTFVDLSGNGMVFPAGQQFGIHVWLESFGPATGASMRSTKGVPKIYSSPELVLQTNCAKGDGLFSQTYFDQRWNGTVYYDCANKPNIAVSNLVGGRIATLDCMKFTPRGIVYTAYSLAGGGPTPTPWGDADLTRPVVILPPVQADPNGGATQTLYVPPIGSGYPVWIQALDWSTGRLSNGLAEVIG